MATLAINEAIGNMARELDGDTVRYVADLAHTGRITADRAEGYIDLADAETGENLGQVDTTDRGLTVVGEKILDRAF